MSNTSVKGTSRKRSAPYVERWASFLHSNACHRKTELSLTVLAIAIAPAAIVATVAVRTKSRNATGVAAAIASVVGLSTGSPHYALLDVFAVAVATFMFWPRAGAVEQKLVVVKPQPSTGFDIVRGILFGSLLLAVILALVTKTPSHAPEASGSSPSVLPIQPSIEAPLVPSTRPVNQESVRSVNSTHPNSSARQHSREQVTPVINEGYGLRAAPGGNATQHCEYKAVMTDDDYRACGLIPPR